MKFHRLAPAVLEMHKTNMLRAVLSVLVCGAMAEPAHGQEMEPKAYSASPIGANFLVTSFTRSTGDVVSDATLPKIGRAHV